MTSTATAEHKSKPVTMLSKLVGTQPTIQHEVFRTYVHDGLSTIRPFAKVVEITPDLAEFMLSQNNENRTVSNPKVEEYARDMKAGRFDGLNGETIKIAKDGSLIDGQHRLKAVIDSATSLWTLVVFGVNRESRMTVDQGKVRSMADYSQMAGVVSKEDAKHFAATANICHAFDNNELRGIYSGNKKINHGSVRKGAITKSELLQYERDNVGGLNEALESVGRKDLHVLGGRSRIAAAYFIIRRFNRNSKDIVDGFFQSLISGEGLSGGNPILTLRKRLLEDKTYGHPSHFATLQVIIKAWNAHVRNEKAQRFNVTQVIPDVEIA